MHYLLIIHLGLRVIFTLNSAFDLCVMIIKVFRIKSPYYCLVICATLECNLQLHCMVDLFGINETSVALS